MIATLEKKIYGGTKTFLRKCHKTKKKRGKMFEGLLFSFHVHLDELFGYILRESVEIYITYQSCSNGALNH